MPSGGHNKGVPRRKYVVYTEAERTFLMTVNPQTGTIPTDAEFLAKFPDRDTLSVQNFRKRHNLMRSTAIEEQRRGHYLERKPDPLPPLAELPEDPDEWDAHHALAFADHMAKARQIAAGIAPSDSRANWTFPERLPVGVCFVGDFHVGASGVEWFNLKQDLKTIGETDGLYVIGMGDYAEGITGSMGKLSTALHSLGAFPDRRTQQLALIEVTKQCQSKWLAFAEGNHDGWSDRQAAYNFTYDIAKAIGAPFFREAGGSIYITVGDVEYLIAVAHDWHGKSRINPSNKQRRMLEEWNARERPDVVCTAHTHHNLTHQEPKNGMDPVYLNSGTYKTADRYSTDRKFHPAWGLPMAMLYPDTRVVVPIYGAHFRTHGLAILAAERERYRRERAA